MKMSMEKMQIHDGHKKCSEHSEHLRCMKRRYGNEKRSLTKGARTLELVSSRKTATLKKKRYQDSQELRSQLESRLRTAYTWKLKPTRSFKPRVQWGSSTIQLWDPQTGVCLFGGDVFASGAALNRRDVLHSLMKEMRRIRRKWKKRSATRTLTKMEIINRLKSVDNKAVLLERVLKGADGSNGLTEVTLVDQAERSANRRERESIKQMRNRCCIQKDPCPYCPMTQYQYRTLKQLYTNDLWEMKGVRTIYGEKERDVLLKKYQALLPTKTEAIVHSLLTDKMCEKTAREVENKAKCTGMSIREILVSILMISGIV